MADTSNLTNFLEDVADAIRAKKGIEDPIPAANFDTEIAGIETGSDTSDATATADDIISPKTAYVNGKKITGGIIAEYASEGLSSEMTLVSNSSTQRVIGFSKDNLFSIELDYTNKQFIIRDRNFVELKTVPITDVISSFNGTVTYDGRMYISISNNNIHNNPNCYYVYVILGNFRDYVTVFNFETLTFNYQVEDYAGFYDVLPEKVWEEGVMISQIYFSELEDNVAFGYSYDGNNYNRFYKLTLNSNGTVTKVNLGPGANLGHKDYAFGITSSANGSILQLLLASGKVYDDTSTTMIKRLVYISPTFEATYVATSINYIFSPSGQLAVDSTGVYHNTFDVSTKKFTIGEKILDFSSTMNALYFINENTVVCFGNNNKQLKIIIFNVDEKTYIMNTYNLDYPFTHRSILTENRLNVINQQYSKLDITANDILYKITKDNINLYNPYNTTASIKDIMQGATAYTKDGKVIGTMPNNGDVSITPTTEKQIKDSGYYSSLKVEAVDNSIDSNIIAENIKEGVSILGVVGALSSGVDTSDATATVNDIAQDKTAYVNGEKITGTLKKLFELSYIVNDVIWTDETDLEQLRLDIPLLGDGIVTSNQTKTVVILHYDKLAEEIGLTADKIKAGETILGITGTYAGEIDVSL